MGSSRWILVAMACFLMVGCTSTDWETRYRDKERQATELQTFRAPTFSQSAGPCVPLFRMLTLPAPSIPTSCDDPCPATHTRLGVVGEYSAPIAAIAGLFAGSRPPRSNVSASSQESRCYLIPTLVTGSPHPR